MKIGIMSGARKNCGDYLIVSRAEKLLQQCFSDAEFVRFDRTVLLDDSIGTLNKCHFLVFAGGPAFLQETYPNFIPFVSDISRIKVPVYTLGLGWYGLNDLNDTIYINYVFNDQTKQFWKWINGFYTLSCRDYYTVRNLKNQGFSDVVMTGCPAWFDLINLEKEISVKHTSFHDIKTICISDPAYMINFSRGELLFDAISELFPTAKKYFLFHRGIKSDEFTSSDKVKKTIEFAERLKNKGAVVKDIAFSEKGFEFYDNADLHIGFRVHAHIYNISRHNYSILIEEDARGRGVNDALGLFGIRPYDTMITYSDNTVKTQLIDNVGFVEDVVCSIDRLLTLGNLQIKQTNEKLKFYHEIMTQHIYGFSK